MNISETKICETCHTEIDTIKHAFLECSKTVDLWKQVEKMFKNEDFNIS